MPDNTQSAPNEKQLTSLEDFSNVDFEAIEKTDDALQFGSEILNDRCIDFRLAVITLTKSKQELIGNFFQESPEEQEKIKEMWMTTLERLLDTKQFIKTLAEMNKVATARLLSVMATIHPEEQKEIH